MARTQHDAVWRAQRQLIDVLDTNFATRLTSTKPAGLNVTAPASGAYYAVGRENRIRDHHSNHLITVYVYPIGRETRGSRTGTGTRVQVRLTYDVAVAIKLLPEAGAADFAASWKTLEPADREYYRLRTLLGTASDVIDEFSRNGDDIMDARFRESTTDLDLQPNQAGEWGRIIYTIDQEVTIRRQSAIA